MGKIELDHTGSGGGVTLSSDGTNLLLGGSAVGGGADLYAANEVNVTAQPSATGDDAVAIGDSATASGGNDFAIGRSAAASGGDSVALGYDTTASGNASFAALNSTASGSAAIAIGGTAVSSGTSTLAIGYGTDATSDFSTAVGRNAQARATSANAFGRDAYAIGTQATAIGDSYASGTDSFAAAIANNTSSYGATGANSISMGYQNKATGSKSVAIGSSNQATNSFATAIGTGNYATHYASVALGSGNLAYAGYGICMGYDNAVYEDRGFASGQKALARTKGQFARASGGQGNAGEMQTSWFTLNCRTTDATTKIMGAENGSNGTLSTDQIFLPNDAAMSFTGTIVACGPDGTKTGGWEIRGHLKNAAGTTTLPASSITELYNPEGWTVALTAHDAHNSLRISVTGEANLEVWWSAQIMSSEVVNN